MGNKFEGGDCDGNVSRSRPAPLTCLPNITDMNVELPLRLEDEDCYFFNTYIPIKKIKTKFLFYFLIQCIPLMYFIISLIFKIHTNPSLALLSLPYRYTSFSLFLSFQ